MGPPALMMVNTPSSSLLSQNTMTPVQQSPNIDIELFIDEIKSVAGLEAVTAMFLKNDEDGKGVYGQYNIPKKLAHEKRFEKEAKFLMSYRQYMDDEKHQTSVIPRVYRRYYQLDSEKINFTIDDPIFDTVDLSWYLEPSPQTSDTEAVPQDFFSETDPYRKFLLAEEGMVRALLAGMKKEEGHIGFFPLPIISKGYLIGMVYLIYDRDKTKINYLVQKRILVRLITRFYETLVQVAENQSYSPQPSHPLSGFEEVCTDLNLFFPYPKDPNRETLYPVISSNPFLMDLEYDQYYRDIFPSIEAGAQPMLKRYRAELRSALIAIIVDSFAHNIGAHGLVALKWWFERRFKTMDKGIEAGRSLHKKGIKLHEKVIPKYDSDSTNTYTVEALSRNNRFHQLFDDSDSSLDKDILSLIDLIRWKNPDPENRLFQFSYDIELDDFPEDETKWIDLPLPVDHAVFRFLEYLRDKSALWSGVTRDVTFGGISMKWLDIIKKFISNPLFLGSIAHTEGINRVNFFVEILEENVPGEQNSVIVSGEFAKINLDIMRSDPSEGNATIRKDDHEIIDEGDPTSPRIYSEYAFMREGKDFSRILPYLQELEEVFLPNGVIGQQALLTLFENTLRNIKHYRDFLVDIRKSGINLYLSIQPTRFGKREPEGDGSYFTSENKLFKVGTWLHHEQNLLRYSSSKEEGIKVFRHQKKIYGLITKEGVHSMYQVNQRGEIEAFPLSPQEIQSFLERLDEEEVHFYQGILGDHRFKLHQRILSKDGKPVLGGSAQDRVCASMLFNNRFESIDESDALFAKKHYFPYVYPATEEYWNPDDREEQKIPDDQIFHIVYNQTIRSPQKEIRHQKYDQAQLNYLVHLLREKELRDDRITGVFKKYFHVWKAKNSKIIQNNINKQNDNPTRMKVVIVDENEYQGAYETANLDPIPSLRTPSLYQEKSPFEKAVYDLRREGVIRIIRTSDELNETRQKIVELSKQLVKQKKDQASTEETREQISEAEHDQYTKAMIQWVGEWLQFDKPSFVLNIRKPLGGDKPWEQIGQIIFTEQDDQYKIEYKCADDVFLDETKVDRYVSIDHGNSNHPSDRNICKVRTYGSLIREMYQVGNMGEIDTTCLNAVLAARFLECLCTNVVIFDDRVHDHIQQERDEDGNIIGSDVYQEQLGLEVFPENHHFFEKQKEKLLAKAHFFIVHLSFLESIEKPKFTKVKYQESEVFQFYKDNIEKHLNNRNNILFVITSGRGRSDWVQDIEHEQITFQPIEAIVGAIEDGISMNDFFQVKYNLAHILFGS